MLVRLTRHGKNVCVMQHTAVAQGRGIPPSGSPERYTAFQDVSALIGGFIQLLLACTCIALTTTAG